MQKFTGEHAYGVGGLWTGNIVCLLSTRTMHHDAKRRDPSRARKVYSHTSGSANNAALVTFTIGQIRWEHFLVRLALRCSRSVVRLLLFCIEVMSGGSRKPYCICLTGIYTRSMMNGTTNAALLTAIIVAWSAKSLGCGKTRPLHLAATAKD